MAWCVCSSTAMAPSTWGSPKTSAKPNASRPAITPTIMPRISRARTIAGPPVLVAGEAEQVPSVVHELMHVHAGDDGGGPLLDPDEIERQHEQDAEDQPGGDRAHRNRDRRRARVQNDIGHGDISWGSCVPSECRRLRWRV